MDSPQHTEEDQVDKWTDMAPNDWFNAISEPGSTFHELYKTTKKVIERLLSDNNHDCILDVGCGTGDVIAALDTNLPRIGMDINPHFIQTCKAKFPSIEFDTVDATELMAWWQSFSGNKGYSNPLIICCNNTMNIVPTSIRYRMISQMREVCGKDGKILVSYWNGQYFSHGVADFYLKNEQLCGSVDINQHINWADQTLVSSTGYHTQWLKPEGVLRLMQSYDINCKRTDDVVLKEDCLFVKGLGIFVLFGSSTSGSRDFYDSEDAQKFYSHIWGEHTIHIGRYDNVTLLSEDPVELANQVVAAQDYLEEDLCRLIKSKMQHDTCDKAIPSRFLDMGCGFGGLMRRVAKKGWVRNGVAVDLSFRMCEVTRKLNEADKVDDVVTVVNESYFNTSVASESMDFVIGVDAFFLAGDRFQEVLKEAYRVLRPGGWIILTDVVQRAGAKDMQKVYDALPLRFATLNTVETYKTNTAALGFGSFSFLSHASNLPVHFNAIKSSLKARRGEMDLAQSFLDEMEAGLTTLSTMPAAQLDWGTFAFQKVL